MKHQSTARKNSKLMKALWRCLLIPQEGAPPYFLSLQVSSETSSHTKSSSSQPSVLRQSHCCQKLWSSIFFEKPELGELYECRWILGTECGLRASGMGEVAWRRCIYSSLFFVLSINIFNFSCTFFFTIYFFNCSQTVIVSTKCIIGSDCGLSCSCHWFFYYFQNKR